MNAADFTIFARAKSNVAKGFNLLTRPDGQIQLTAFGKWANGGDENANGYDKGQIRTNGFATPTCVAGVSTFDPTYNSLVFKFSF